LVSSKTKKTDRRGFVRGVTRSIHGQAKAFFYLKNSLEFKPGRPGLSKGIRFGLNQGFMHWTCSITRLVIEQVLAKCSAFCCFLAEVV
jgi:hypothetical protein